MIWRVTKLRWSRLRRKHHVLFVECREPAVSVVMDAKDGKVITTLPIGTGVDGAGFMPKTLEAFSSQGDGTLTVVKERNPQSFEVEQTLKTMSSAKTNDHRQQDEPHLPDRRRVRTPAPGRSRQSQPPLSPRPLGGRLIHHS